MSNNNPTIHENKLFEALKKRGVNCVQHHKDYYEKKNGVKSYKTIDIYLPDDKIFIEVDGKHHITEPETIISDFNRDYFSFKEHFFTKHITNEAIDTHLDEIADAIAKINEDAPNKIGDNLNS